MCCLLAWQCKAEALGDASAGVICTAERNPAIHNITFQYTGLCWYCWLTNSLNDPGRATFTIITFLMCLGMIKMLVCQCCCRTKDGRFIDVAGILLGTANPDHTWKYDLAYSIRSNGRHYIT